MLGADVSVDCNSCTAAELWRLYISCKGERRGVEDSPSDFK